MPPPTPPGPEGSNGTRTGPGAAGQLGPHQSRRRSSSRIGRGRHVSGPGANVETPDSRRAHRPATRRTNARQRPRHRPARPRVRVRRAARHRQDVRGADSGEVPQLRERTDRDALQSMRALHRDRGGTLARRHGARRGVPHGRRQHPRIARGRLVCPGSGPLPGADHRRGPHALQGSVQRAAENARGAASARGFHPGHDRDAEASPDDPLALPGLRVSPRLDPEHRRSSPPHRICRGDRRIGSNAGADRTRRRGIRARRAFGSRAGAGLLRLHDRGRRRLAGPGRGADRGARRLRSRHRRPRRRGTSRVARCARGRRTRPRAFLGRMRRRRTRSDAPARLASRW